MKKFFVLIVTLFMGFKAWAQYDITDTVGISGKITKIEFLQKDWNHSDKVKQIYWVEITLKPDSNQVLPHGMIMPRSISFRSGSSGYWPQLDHIRSFKENDFVVVTVVCEYLKQFLKKEKKDILIDKIKRLY